MPYLPMLEGWEVYDYTAILLMAILAAMGVGLLIVWLIDALSYVCKKDKKWKTSLN